MTDNLVYSTHKSSVYTTWTFWQTIILLLIIKQILLPFLSLTISTKKVLVSATHLKCIVSWWQNSCHYWNTSSRDCQNDATSHSLTYNVLTPKACRVWTDITYDSGYRDGGQVRWLCQVQVSVIRQCAHNIDHLTTSSRLDSLPSTVFFVRIVLIATLRKLHQFEMVSI